MKQKDNEIHYLQSQLAKKDDENSKLKTEMEKLLLDQMNSIDTIKKTGVDSLEGSDPQESSQIISQLNKKIEILQYQLKRAENQVTNTTLSLEKQAF